MKETKIPTPIVLAIKTIVAEYPSIIHEIETILCELYLGNEERVPDVLAEFVHMIIQKTPNIEITYNIKISDFMRFFTHCRLVVISLGTHSKDKLEFLTETVECSIHFFETNVFAKLRNTCGNEILDAVFKGNTIDILQSAASKLEQLIENDMNYMSQCVTPTNTIEEVKDSIIVIPKKNSIVSSDSRNEIPAFTWNSVNLESPQPPASHKRESCISTCMTYLFRKWCSCTRTRARPPPPEPVAIPKPKPIYCDRCSAKLKKINTP